MTGKPIGRPPLKRGEKSVHLGVRVPESIHEQLLAEVERTNARLVPLGATPVTVGWVTRLVIIRGLASPASAEALPPLTGDTLKAAWDRAVELAVEQGEDVEKLLADAAQKVEAWRTHEGPMGADEVVTSQPTHRKRVRAPVPNGEPENVVRRPDLFVQEAPGDAPEGAPGDDSDEVDAEALLRGTPL